jgi:2-dehydro-3-deoxyphosphogluconate aldolase/(4S)-4-hydroxy-2-oxoglutarate aldolase
MNGDLLTSCSRSCLYQLRHRGRRRYSERSVHPTSFEITMTQHATSHPAIFEVVAAVEDAGIVAVIRMKDPGKLRAVVDAIAEGGIRALEITMTVPGAVDLIRELGPTLPDGFVLGAGTVLDADTVARVADAGARYVVSPVFRRSVIDACHARGMAAMPGCFTPTEILEAWDAGADIVKVFPATTLGPSYLKDVRAPLPQVKLMPTGGVTVENAGDWIRAGAVAVGVGTSLLDAKAIADGRFAVLRTNAERMIANVRAARGRD